MPILLPAEKLISKVRMVALLRISTFDIFTFDWLEIPILGFSIIF
jgi:hypothetical protein